LPRPAGRIIHKRTGDEDIRWKQRYRDYERSLANRRDALETADPSRLIKQGTVKAFELAYELAWKTLQEYLREAGITDAVGPKGVIRRACHEGIIFVLDHYV
jgi:nucleotidyltransferase substrate binding protein (TIGR01987 family)